MEYHIWFLIGIVLWAFIGAFYTLFLLFDNCNNRHYNTILFKVIYGPILLFVYILDVIRRPR
jgi:hypothetical protein